LADATGYALGMLGVSISGTLVADRLAIGNILVIIMVVFVVVDNGFSVLETMTAFAYGLIAALALMAAVSFLIEVAMAAAVARVINAVGAGSAIVAKFGV